MLKFQKSVQCEANSSIITKNISFMLSKRCLEHTIMCKISLQKRVVFFENKLTQCAGKVKDLGKAGGCVAGALTKSQAVKQYQFNFKKFLFKSDSKFVGKIPQAPNRYAINFASDIYRKIAISENFK